MALLDLLDDRAVFSVLRLENGVRVVDAGAGLVRRNFDDIEIVDGDKLLLLGQRRTGHTGELAVEAEVVLEGDRCERFALSLDVHVLLGLNGLMQAFAVTAAQHQTAGEFVDDDDLAVFHDVVDVALHNAVRLDGLIDVVRERGVV